MFRLVVRLIGGILLIIATCGHTASAQSRVTDRAERWEFNLQTRYVASMDFTREGGASAEFEDDLGWGFGFGYNINERFNAGFFTTWRSLHYNATIGEGVVTDDPPKYSGTMDIGTIALCADWNVLPSRFTPYASGSIGYTLVNTNIPADVYSGCWYDPFLGYVCGSAVATYGKDAASFSLGAGVRLEVSEAVFFKVGYEYDWLDMNGVEGQNILRIDAGVTFD